jgi:hypothetical protein
MSTLWLEPSGATLEAVSNIAGCHISPHSLRRTAEDIAQHVKVDRDHRRMLQNHKPKDVHDESYANNPDPELLRPAMETPIMLAITRNTARHRASHCANNGGTTAAVSRF